MTVSPKGRVSSVPEERHLPLFCRPSQRCRAGTSVDRSTRALLLASASDCHRPGAKQGMARSLAVRSPEVRTGGSARTALHVCVAFHNVYGMCQKQSGILGISRICCYACLPSQGLVLKGSKRALARSVPPSGRLSNAMAKGRKTPRADDRARSFLLLLE